MAVRVAARTAGSMAVSPGGLGVRWKADCCTERVVGLTRLLRAWLDRGLVGRLAAGLRMAHSLLPGIQSKNGRVVGGEAEGHTATS